MRIIFALPGLDELSGGLRVVAQYAKYLSERGHQITLAVRRPGPVFSRRLAVKKFFGLARTDPLPREQGYFTGLDLPVIQLDDHRPIRAEDLPDADITISTWWTTAEWAESLPPTKGVHVHFIQDHEIFEARQRKRVHAVYRQNNKKIVVAKWLSETMMAEYNRTAIVVPNGVDTNHFRSPPRGRSEPPQVGFLYAHHTRKNVGFSIAVLERLHSICPDIRAIAFGARERPAELPEWITYERQPAQDRIAAIYGSCDLWLFTSISEGFGLPLLEAMASRTPVLATAAGAAPDLVDGSNGRIVASDPEAFVEAALDLLTGDAAAWRAASDAAWSTAQLNSLASASAAFEAALLQAVGHEGTPLYRSEHLSSAALRKL